MINNTHTEVITQNINDIMLLMAKTINNPFIMDKGKVNIKTMPAGLLTPCSLLKRTSMVRTMYNSIVTDKVAFGKRKITEYSKRSRYIESNGNNTDNAVRI